MSVAMSNCGALGWVSDRRAYRYSPIDPDSGQPWPAMPAVLQALAMGGGLSQRGTERGVRIHRRGEDGAVRVLTPQLNDLVQADDVIVVREALF